MTINYSTNSECAICYQPYGPKGDSDEHDAYRLNCGHAFGRKCVKMWSKQANFCPFCNLKSFQKNY